MATTCGEITVSLSVAPWRLVVAKRVIWVLALVYRCGGRSFAHAGSRRLAKWLTDSVKVVAK